MQCGIALGILMSNDFEPELPGLTPGHRPTFHTDRMETAPMGASAPQADPD